MPSPVKLSKSDARRALVRHHFSTFASQMDVYARLKSVQFDPIAPVGCNHDLVMQARVPGYRIGDWEDLAYEQRAIYDGWDKMASLVPYEGWPLRRLIYDLQRKNYDKKIFVDHKEAVDAILKEIETRGPLMPKECDFQLKRQEWADHWYGPSVTKQTLRALWHAGLVMTTKRKKGQHLYDLTERVVPSHLYNQPRLPDSEARLELAFERHQVMGILRPSSAPEVWGYQVMYYHKRELVSDLAKSERIVPVDVEGMKAHSTPEFLSLLDQPSIEPRVAFVAPLDPFMWDRKMTAHLFDFDYVWEIYTPLAKRRWGYYVLPVLFGDRLVARVEFWCRDGFLEVREWHWEPDEVSPSFWPELERAVKAFMAYCSASAMVVKDHVEPKVRKFMKSIRPL